MFADEIAVELQNRDSYYAAMCNVPQIQQALDSSQKFVFDQTMVEAMDSLIATKPSNFLSVLPLARAPFDITWIEFRIILGNDIRDVGLLINEPETGSGQMIARCFTRRAGGKSWLLGVLMVLDLSNEVPDWTAAHSFARNIGLLDAQIELGLKLLGNIQDKSVEQLREEVIPEAAAQDAKVLGESDTELKARVELTRRVLPVIDYLMFKPQAIDKYLDDMVNRAMPLWQGDLFYLMTLLAFLNTKNCIETESVPAVNKSAKYRRRPLARRLYEHKKLRLVLSKAQQNRLSSEGVKDPAGRRLHLVRGHFKIRNGKLFWWSPFIRGRKEQGLLTKDYDVTQ